MAAPLLKNSKNAPSLSFTMVYLSFFVCLLWLLVSILSVPYIRAFDAGVATGWIAPLLALYFGRQWTDSRTAQTTTTTVGEKTPTPSDPPSA